MMAFRTVALVCLSLLVLAAPATLRAGDTVAQAVALYAGLEGKVDQAQARSLLEGAQAEDPLAAFWLARLGLLRRCGLTLTHAEADAKAKEVIAGVEAAVAAKRPGATFCLASAYQSGLGVTADTEKAFTLYEQAATQEKDPLALHNMAVLLLSGAISMDRAAAVQAAGSWLDESAQGGNAYASLVKGLLAQQGVGRDKDPAAARLLYEEAAKAGLPLAQVALARLIGKQEPAVAAELFQRAAAQGDLEGLRGWARCQAGGQGTTQNLPGAIATWEQMALVNDPQALRYLGLAYILGDGVERDEERGQELLTKAQAAGDTDAATYLSAL